MKKTNGKAGRGQEKYLIKAVLDYLRSRAVFSWRNNTGAFKRDNHFYRFGEVGSADIFALKNGKLYGLECKGAGGKLSEAQEEFGKRFEKAGGVYLVIYEIEDVQRAGL